MTADVMREPRTYTYGNEKRARAYVQDITANGIQSGPVYVTVAPGIRSNPKMWNPIIRRLRELLPGKIFHTWVNAADGLSRYDGDKLDYFRDRYAGNILVGKRFHHMLRIGGVALSESTDFAWAGKPTMVFTGARLAAWPDCQVLTLPLEKRDKFTAAYVLLPMRPLDRPLPTLTASLHMLGIRDNKVITKAAGIVPRLERAEGK